MFKIIWRFIRNKKGVTAIEFAIVLPILLLFICSIFEFGLMMHVSSIVQNATQEAARLTITGKSYEDLNPTNLSRKDFLRAYLKKRIGSWVNSSDQLVIQAKVLGNATGLNNNVYNQFSNEDDADKTNDKPVDEGSGDGNNIVIYKITFNWDIIMPIMSHFIGENGRFPITAVAVIENEDFGDD